MRLCSATWKICLNCKGNISVGPRLRCGSAVFVMRMVLYNWRRTAHEHMNKMFEISTW